MAAVAAGTRIAALPGCALGTAQGAPGAAGTFPVEWDEPVTGAPDSTATDEFAAHEGVAWRLA